MKDNTEYSIEELIQVHPLLWASYAAGGINLGGGKRYSIANFKYQNYLLTDKKVMNVKKGTQIGATLVYQFDAIHGLIYKRYPLGVIYMMPSEKLVQRFSKIRFTPMFDDNPHLNKYLNANVQNANEKIINGGSLIFVGARPVSVGGSNTKDSENLRVFSADKIIRDEVDLHDPQMVEQSKQRLNASAVQEEVNLGSPTFPGHGIDVMYEQSDQGVIQTKCSCGKFTCLERDFPRCMDKRNGLWVRVCVHCGKELNVNDNILDITYKDRDEGGLWLSTFQSPMANISKLMSRYEKAEGSSMCEWMRSTLGVASVESENQVSAKDVYSKCGQDAPQEYSSVPTIMGVDVGKTLHAVVGVKQGRDSFKILAMKSIPLEQGFHGLHDLAKKMNVKMCVIDANPDTHASTEFQRNEPYPVYRCFYSEQMPGPPDFNTATGNVKVNRNQWCDRVHSTFTTAGQISIPRRCPDVDDYATQMTMTVKQTVENPNTGMKKPMWIKLSSGNDHFFHATLYFLLAASVSPVVRTESDIERYTKAICKVSL